VSNMPSLLLRSGLLKEPLMLHLGLQAKVVERDPTCGYLSI
jgi:hypothetical protein